MRKVEHTIKGVRALSTLFVVVCCSKLTQFDMGYDPINKTVTENP